MRQQKSYPLIIIGGGPAGLGAAIAFGKDALLLEQNPYAGKKLIISGLGQCNCTNVLPVKKFLETAGKQKSFLATAIYNFDNTQLISLLQNNGCPVYAREDGKVFPVSMQSVDVRDTLVKIALASGADIAYNQSVTSIEKQNDTFKVKTDKQVFVAHKLLIATGGKSYPTTGSNGYGYELAKRLGHTIILLKPALSAVKIRGFSVFAKCAGVTLNKAKISYVVNGKKKVFEGELLFTHQGLSGPVIINNSHTFEQGGVIRLHLAQQDEIRATLLSKNNQQRMTYNTLKTLGIPESLAKTLLNRVNINIESKPSELNKVKRNELITTVSAVPFTIESLDSFNKAMLTAGGVSLKEVASKTMESKIISGLYFSGEILDYVLPTGGFNIQAAFSTGYLAGQSAKKSV
ncbi:MAG: aminoacetone oxidase family FAD-binding enzyme [Candidatus Cloacimonas sp.]|nr:aminoacetone oxidase family FAD-binding enzyme [Candidatus Cloacimonadota bacterium]